MAIPRHTQYLRIRATRGLNRQDQPGYIEVASTVDHGANLSSLYVNWTPFDKNLAPTYLEISEDQVDAILDWMNAERKLRKRAKREHRDSS